MMRNLLIKLLMRLIPKVQYSKKFIKASLISGKVLNGVHLHIDHHIDHHIEFSKQPDATIYVHQDDKHDCESFHYDNLEEAEADYFLLKQYLGKVV